MPVLQQRLALTDSSDCAKLPAEKAEPTLRKGYFMSRPTPSILMLVLLAGCSGSGDEPLSERDGASGSGGQVLTGADLDRFLKVVQSHEGAMIPEFTPADEDEALDFNSPADKLVASFQNQCRRLFDIQRQGAIWERDTQWSRALAGSQISPARFAALVRDVSLAIMRVRLDARVDVARLVRQGQSQVDGAVRTIEEIDEVPPADRTAEATALRTRSVMRLGRAVALLEFAELVRDVPAESAAAVRRYSPKLKPLLPASLNEELLAELKRLARSPAGDVEPASYETDDDE
jgi:hypothetical protein